MKLLMCAPTSFQVKYAINPWMTDNQYKVDTDIAYSQWQVFYDKIKQFAEVVLIKQRVSAPDMVFTANAGLVRDKKVALSHFRSHERSHEEDLFEQWFLEKGYTVCRDFNVPFEGAGDFLSNSMNDNFLGYGFRSSGSVTPFLFRVFPHLKWYPIKLTDPRFYHLDTCFCPLDGNTIMCYPDALDRDIYERVIKKEFGCLEVTEEEASQFACNAVVIGKNVFMPKCYSVADRLDKLGFTPHLFDMSEFIKAGGACKCLTLEI